MKRAIEFYSEGSNFRETFTSLTIWQQEKPGLLYFCAMVTPE